MTWTYSGDPASSDKDTVRFLVGDTDINAQELSDEEVLWLLTIESTPSRAAARGAETLASKYAKLVDKSIGAASISASQRYEHYRQMSLRLWATETSAGAVPFAGGISETSKNEISNDPDRVEPSFSFDMMVYVSPLEEG